MCFDKISSEYPCFLFLCIHKYPQNPTRPSACFTRNSDLLPELCTGTSQNILSTNLLFTWRPYNKADCPEHSLSSASVALKAFSSLTASTSSAIFIQGTPAGPVMRCDGKLFAYIWNHCSWYLGWGWGETFIKRKGQWSKMLRQLVGQWVTATKHLAPATKQLNVTSSKRPTGCLLLIHSHTQAHRHRV